MKKFDHSFGGGHSKVSEKFLILIDPVQTFSVMKTYSSVFSCKFTIWDIIIGFNLELFRAFFFEVDLALF